ncbi:MAG: L-ribulose-5-phosphate 4-epimerase [Mariniphaga sp.]
MLAELKKLVFKANLDLVKYKLVLFTWGNASGIDRDKGLVVIKPSGVEYDEMTEDQMVVVDMEGNVIEGNLRPSSDTATHLALYKAFGQIGGIVHTHSTFATSWAQAGVAIPIIGTTHADYFAGDIPCTRDMSHEEVMGNYEKETGSVIIERFRNLNYNHIPGVLVKNHGPFTWGKNTVEAVHNSIVLEEIAKMAFITRAVNPDFTMNNLLTEKHFDRKHGTDAYYGQK